MAFNRALLTGSSVIALTAGLAGALTLLATPVAAATTVAATTPADITTAVSDANAGQTVTVTIAPGVTIDLTGATIPAYATAGGSLTIDLAGELRPRGSSSRT